MEAAQGGSLTNEPPWRGAQLSHGQAEHNHAKPDRASQGQLTHWFHLPELSCVFGMGIRLELVL